MLGLPEEKPLNAVRGPLSRLEAAEFARQLSGMATAGLPLPSGLRALSEELPRGALRTMLHDLASRVEAGESLDSALEAEGPRFPAPLRGLIVAGVRSGRLAEALGRFLEMDDLGDSLRRRLSWGLLYPLMMLLISFAMFILVATITTTGFEEIFRDFGISVPWITQVLLKASRGFASAGWSLVFGPILGFVILWLAMRLLLAGVERDRMVQPPIRAAV